MLTLIGLGALGAFGTGVAAKMGLVDYKLKQKIMGCTIDLEFNQKNLIKLVVS